MRHGQREMNRQMNISLGLQCFRERISSSVVERCGGGGGVFKKLNPGL